VSEESAVAFVGAKQRQYDALWVFTVSGLEQVERLGKLLNSSLVGIWVENIEGFPSRLRFCSLASWEERVKI
jgi:hypothetical protein